jgi:rSAM/selenodomain-associated transferase 1
METRDVRTPAVGLFAKPATVGAVKSRLSPPLTPEQGSELYAAFLADIADMLDSGEGWEWLVFSTDVPAQMATWPESAPRPAAWREQQGPDLGTRMHRALEQLLAEGRDAALIIGSDHPTLPRELIDRALAMLEIADVVFGPSLDGGYYLVGMTEPHPRLFEDIPWSTANVLALTLDRIAELQLRPSFLPPWYDVDTPADLRFLQVHLRASALDVGEAPCPHTRLVLEKLGAT